MSKLKDELARVWAADLTGRLAVGQTVHPQRRPKTAQGGREIEPPFTVLTVRRMEQTTPGSNVWTAEVRLVVVCDKDQGDSPAQEARVEALRAALEATPVPCEDGGVRLYGFVLETIEQAAADKVFSDVLFVTAGVGDLASSPDAVEV